MKWTPDKVEIIRAMYLDAHHTDAYIAEFFGVSRYTISNVRIYHGIVRPLLTTKSAIGDRLRHRRYRKQKFLRSHQ